VRFLFKEFFSYVPTWKLWLAANHKPTIRGTDLAIWRRIPLIPFTVTIGEDEIDRQLPKKLEAEAPGILAWAVRGCAEWQQQGLNPPEAVKDASQGYRQEMDVVGRFITDCCIEHASARIAKAELFQAYKTWCEANNEYAESHRSFGQRLRERPGIDDAPRGTGGEKRWQGIGLNSEQE
jgi:putative DNA primase/helicase